MELWEKVQEMLDTQKKSYQKYAKRQQPVAYMLKGLVKCSACGGTLAMASTKSGKNQLRTMQCCNYAKGRCHTSHSITMPRIEDAFLQGLEQAIADKKFTISPSQKKSASPSVDYDKLIAIEERKLERAKQSYLAEVDTLEQYKQNKAEITTRIEELKAKQNAENGCDIDVNVFAKKVIGIVEFCKRDDITASAKNEALHTIIEKIVFEKANNNIAIFFHDI